MPWDSGAQRRRDGEGYSASWAWKGHQLCGCARPIFMSSFIRLPLQPASSRARARIAKKRIGCPHPVGVAVCAGPGCATSASL